MAVPVLVGERRLRALFPAYIVLLRRELCFPFLLGFDRLFQSLSPLPR